MSRLQGKVAVVTGASKGIGASIAEHLAAEGAAVVVNYSSSKAGADAVVKRIRNKGGKRSRCKPMFRSPRTFKRLFAEAKTAFGKFDILVNNAGIYEFFPLESITAEHFHKQFNLNVLGLLLVTQEAVKHFGHEGGASSISVPWSANSPIQTASVYSGTKAAVNAITSRSPRNWGRGRSASTRLIPAWSKPKGCTRAAWPQESFAAGSSAMPLGRIAQPEDIGKVAAFFASDDAGWVTGQTLILAGGQRQ